MTPVPCVSWEDFEQEVKKLRSQYDKDHAQLIFRGQGNSEWKLETTLERNLVGDPKMRLKDYYHLTVARMSPELRTFADVEIPEYDPNRKFDKQDLFLFPPYRFPDPENYE
jgi:hypothetical protein